jgi:hypothetical protein
MGPRKLYSTAFFAIVLVGAALGFAACGDSGNPEPNPSLTTSSGPGGGVVLPTGSGGNGQGGTAGHGQGGSGGGTGGDCTGAANCYNCAPKKPDQFLNHCTDATCAPFDDVARLPRYNGGNLPPIQ